MHALDDTIAAIATAPGGAARGIVRISGPGAIEVVAQVFSPTDATAWKSFRTATRAPGTIGLRLAGRSDEQRVPCDLYLWRTARSYTRQPVAELHTLGSPPLVEALLRHVCAAGARLAEPGEFTLRAFVAGRIDLVQAEAVLGVIDAADRRQLDVALAQLAGGLTRPLAAIRDQLLDLLADLEAGLDFVEEDIRFLSHADLTGRLAEAADAIAQLVEQLRGRERADAEPRVVLAGCPNVGKSSLFNALAGDAAALVSARPGTTRDYLSARMEIGGLSCQLIDTAGLESAPSVDELSTAARQISHEQHEQADLRLLCLDSSRPQSPWEEAQIHCDGRQLVVLTKCDLPAAYPSPPAAIETSTITGRGLDELRAAIHSRLTAGAAEANPSGAVASTAARCRESLRLAAESLTRARDVAGDRGGDELIAAEIRTALVELGKVVGTIYTDDLLDRIFSRFCIGK
jgi:tRNA modification GTPase